MTAPVGPYAGVTGLLSGVAEGMERQRKEAQAKAAQADAKAEKDRRYNIDVADAEDRQGKFLTDLGFVEGTPAQVTTPGATVTLAHTGMGGPLDAMSKRAPSLLNAAVTAFKTEGQTLTAPGTPYTVKTPRGTTRQGYLDPTQTPEAIKTREAAALQDAETKKLVAAEQAKAADAETKAKTVNEQNFGAFQAAFPEHPAAKAYQPGKDYKLLLDVVGKQADRKATLDAAKVNRDATIAAARANAELAHDDRQAALAAKGTGATKTLPAPLAARVGQFGEMLKKSADLMPMVDDMDVTLGKSMARDIADHGIAGLPGTKGLGEAMVAKSPAYAQYQAALQPFILAAAHAMSGARINQDQTEKIRKSIELAPGDFANQNVQETEAKKYDRPD